MNFLHVVSNSNYAVTEAYIEFVNNNFNEQEHLFLVMDKTENIPHSILSHSNVKELKVNSKFDFRHLNSYFKNSHKVLLHGLSFNNYQRLWLLTHPRYFNKLVWIAWGNDLYHWKRDNTSIINRINNKIGYNFRKKIQCFVGVFPPDINFFKKKFQSDAKTFYASYGGNLNENFYKKEMDLVNLSEKRQNKNQINIQIGHQGNPTLNHIDVLNELEKFKYKNIKVYIPLSYGHKKYIENVEKTAKQLYGDQVVCMKEMMPKDDYMDFLSTMDIIIFNTERQIGLGNIVPLLYMEKKLYIPSGTVMYDFYRSHGIEIIDYNNVKTMNFEEFTSPTNMNNAKRYVIENELNKSKKIEMWSKVFNAPIE